MNKYVEPSLRPVTVVGIGPDSFELDIDGLARLNRFQSRTAYTFATTRSTDLYRNEVVRMAMEVGFCMDLVHVDCADLAASVSYAHYSSHHSSTRSTYPDRRHLKAIFDRVLSLV